MRNSDNEYEEESRLQKEQEDFEIFQAELLEERDAIEQIEAAYYRLVGWVKRNQLPFLTNTYSMNLFLEMYWQVRPFKYSYTMQDIKTDMLRQLSSN